MKFCLIPRGNENKLMWRISKFQFACEEVRLKVWFEDTKSCGYYLFGCISDLEWRPLYNKSLKTAIKLRFGLDRAHSGFVNKVGP